MAALLDLIDRNGESSEDYLTEADVMEEFQVSNLVKNHLPNLCISRICKVNNRFLKAMYESKKEEYESRYGQVTEKLLFHATSKYSVDSIVENNLDWRRVSRSKFGVGVSFSDDADYANFFSNSSNGVNRAFIVANVLISNECTGYSSMTIPPANFDTSVGTRNGMKKVYVKYNDNEFLPKFVVYYTSPERSESRYYIKFRRRRFL